MMVVCGDYHLARPTKASQHRIFLLATARRSHYLQPQAAQCIMIYSGDVHSRRRYEKYGCCLARYNEFPTLEQTCMNLSGSQEHCHLVPHYLRGAQEKSTILWKHGQHCPLPTPNKWRHDTSRVDIQIAPLFGDIVIDCFPWNLTHIGPKSKFHNPQDCVGELTIELDLPPYKFSKKNLSQWIHV